MTDRGALHRLAERHGIATAYDDARGNRRTPPDDTLRALLAAVGIDPAHPGAADEVDAAAWTNVMPSATVVRDADQPVRLRVSLPEARTGDTLHLRVVEETGRVFRQVFRPGDHAATGTATLGGVAYRACEVGLEFTLAQGYHDLALGTRLRSLSRSRVIVVPAACHRPEGGFGNARAFGPAVQLYALRSERNWGIGDFTDLRLVAEQWAARGAGVIGVNPLHALFGALPQCASPYSPSSRRFLNPIYLDVEAVADYAECGAAREQVRQPPFQMRLRALRSAELVDYPGAAAAKREVLETLFAHFAEHHLRQGTPRGREFRAYAAAGSDSLRRFALFEALQEHFLTRMGGAARWWQWPAPYHDPDSLAVRRFVRTHRTRVDFFAYLQWQCDLQLTQLQSRVSALALRVGLYHDLALSVEPSGADVWGGQGMYTLAATIGAPPDDFSTRGQNWGLAPLLPRRLREAAYVPWIEVLRRNMRGAGALRIDHVMGLWRLFWIPPGGHAADGTYVDYPHEALLGILALESVRNRCAVIGEDLGSVPDEVRATMARMGICSYRLLMFQKDGEGEFAPPAAYPPDALATFASHDLPTLTGYWEGRDLALREELGLFADAAQQEAQQSARAEDRTRLLEALQREGLLPAGLTANPASALVMTPEIARAIHVFLARSPSWLMLVQLEDVLGQVEQVNLPATDDDRYPNWRRKLALPLEAWPAFEPFVALTAATAAENGGGRRGASPGLSQSLAIPRATYRLQLNAAFGFRAAAQVVPYLARLGVSHCYCSPFLKSRPGSTHGYDVVDHNAFNPDLGTAQDFERFAAALRAHGMGMLVDVVPNHMGVMGADNAWWQDVLENGPVSVYSSYFDIDWDPVKRELRGKLLLPLLDGHYGTLLERGELALRFDAAAGEFSVYYFAHRLPIAPREYPRLLGRAAEALAGRLGRDNAAVVDLLSLITAFENLPPRTVRSPEKILERHRDRALCKERLARLCAEAPAVQACVADAVGAYNGTPGDPRSFDALHDLLEAQPYRLADWRAAADEINYRRFFDINELAAVRVEDPTVFDATHPLVLGLLRTGRAQALRIDHPDGLWDPRAYFVRLQQRAAQQGVFTPLRVESGATGVQPAVYLVVEKILAHDERLPPDWPVHGTTGYEFMNLANGVLVDAGAARNLLRFHAAFVGGRQDFDQIVFECKHLVLRHALASELTVLAHELNRLSEADRHTRDFTLNGLRHALAEVIAWFPVYRTYVAADGPGDVDRRYIEWAIARARQGARAQEAGIFEFLRHVLLVEPAAAAPVANRAALLRFVMRFQQLCSPVMAKGCEDTALYRYVPLASLNEVGGDPRRFGVPVREFHDANGERGRDWPHALLATSTHDNKRSEDVRARISVLSELDGEWRGRVHHWALGARPHKREIGGEAAPSAADEYLLYQTLVGAWPLQPATDDAMRDFGGRIAAYMRKAAREAKLHTSWINPNADYEAALDGFIAALLEPRADNPFLADFLPFQRKVATFGMYNSLSQVMLKLTCPGVPDFYQGNELWDFSLVDPDNRRPVDYRLRARLQRNVERCSGRSAAGRSRSMLDDLGDGRAKLHLINRLLALRRADEALFRDGEYVALEVRGARQAHVCAFARRTAGRAAVIIVPRLYARLLDGRPAPPLGPEIWADTCVMVDSLAPAAVWREALTEQPVVVEEVTGAPALRLGQALQHFPVAAVLAGDSS